MSYIFSYNGQQVLFNWHDVSVQQKSLLCLFQPLLCGTLRGATLITSSTGAQSRKGRVRLPIIRSYLPWGLMLKSDTQTHRDVSESSSCVKNLTAKFQKKLLFFYSSQGNSVSCTLFTPLSLLTADTKSNGKVHTYIFVAGGRRWRDMRSTSGQQLGASNWRGFVSVAHSSP